MMYRLKQGWTNCETPTHLAHRHMVS